MAHLSVGGAIPGLVVLDSKREQAEQAMGTKLVSSTSMASVAGPGLSFPVWVPDLAFFDDEP